MPKAKKNTRKRPVKRVQIRRKLVKRKPVKRKPATRRKRPKNKKPANAGRKLIKQVERSSVERTMAGKRKRRRRTTRRVVMAGRRRRYVSGENGSGGGGSSKLLIGLAIGAAVIYFLTKDSTPTTPYPYSNQQYPYGDPRNALPQLTQTGSYSRNTQAQDVVSWAMAAGLAIDAISRLIDRINSSSDSQVADMHGVVSSTNDFSNYV
jgi:hypothetical protein